MQSKWLFRWKIRATAFYLGRLGFKPLFRSQVKISLVLLSFLTFVFLTQLLLIGAPSGVTGSPGSKAGCPWLQRKRILSVMCVDMEEKRESERGGEKRGKNSEFSLVLAIWKAGFFLRSWSLFYNGHQVHWGRAVFPTFDSKELSYVPWLPPDHT